MINKGWLERSIVGEGLRPITIEVVMESLYTLGVVVENV